jgi:hypothetical protein
LKKAAEGGEEKNCKQMVLAELGNRITAALRGIGSKTVIDKEAVDAMLKEIGEFAFRCTLLEPLIAPCSKRKCIGRG